MEKRRQYRTKWINSITEVSEKDWDALAKPLQTPFLEWDWLYLMEISGSTSMNTGWLPLHLTVWRENRLIAAAPFYLKIHSEGEYVYDQVWVDVAEKIKLAYYPKLVGMSPLTPVIGYRFLISKDENELLITDFLNNVIDQFCIQNKISGCHFLHIDPAWKNMMTNFGYYLRIHSYFAWENMNYGNFNDFLDIFKSNQRRNIRRERSAMDNTGISLKFLTDDKISPHLFSLMYKYYERTCDQFGMWGCKYLTKNFFEEMYGRFRNRLLFVIADKKNSNDDPLGISFCVFKGDQLYGRYWGLGEDVKFLHFNVCYYSPIEWSINNKIKRFDPGIGGDHKKRRGFISKPGYSLHKFYDWRLIQIMRAYVHEYNLIEQERIIEVNNALPFTNKNNHLKEMLPSFYYIN